MISLMNKPLILLLIYYYLLLSDSPSLINNSSYHVINSLPISDDHIPLLRWKPSLKPTPILKSKMHHTCMIDRNSLYLTCWGLNQHGQTDLPTDTSTKHGLVQTTEVSVGGFHTCVITKLHTELVCYGMNNFGQCSPPDDDVEEFNRGYFRDIHGNINPNPDKVKLVSTGLHFTCIVYYILNKVKCFGQNELDSLISPDLFNIDSPYDVDLMSSGAYHTCTITRIINLIKCWGANDSGQLTHPAELADRKVKHLSAGCVSTCVLLDYKEGVNGSNLVCFGGIEYAYSDVYGRGGKLIRSKLYLTMSVGLFHYCVVDIVGVLYCYGYSDGDGKFKDVNGIVDIENILEKTPVPFELGVGGDGCINVAMGYEHICAVDMQMNTRCWGSNKAGQLDVPE
eukprot:Mrub_03786.p1 GENE.Mrub_03786~~Mrub_03786.p1  ORF type:complete len:396 (+),score=58.00 Mrub_03786:54-1241(+)